MDALVRPTLPAGATLADTVFAVVDVETNGLSSRRHRVLQVAVVRVQGDGTILDHWSTLVRPGFSRVGRSTRVHGLTRRSLRGAPRFADVAEELIDRLDGTVLTGHNVGFDWAFLRRGLRRGGHPVPDAVRLCTLRLSRSLDPTGDSSHRLTELCTRYGISLTRAHDALADATATAQLLPHLLDAAAITDAEHLSAHLRGTQTAWTREPASVGRSPRWWPTGRAQR
jgi:DNA polymerase III epsilon subunit family exonuclease